jgi:uncharacterized repeat protein (TIGR01451 family)
MHPKIIVLALALALTGAGLAIAEVAPGQPASNLSVSTTASRRSVTPGGTIAFTINVVNAGETPLREVTICDQLPVSVARVIHAGGLVLFAGTACRTLASLPRHSTVVVRLLVRVARHARPGRTRNRALVISSERRASASVSFRITPTARPCPAG